MDPIFKRIHDPEPTTQTRASPSVIITFCQLLTDVSVFPLTRLSQLQTQLFTELAY